MPADPLSLDEHRVLGKRLHQMYVLAIRDHTDLARSYGPGSRIARQADKVATDLGELRSLLDDRLLRDHGTRSDVGSEITRVYYPSSSS
jgi:hypothetical protein